MVKADGWIDGGMSRALIKADKEVLRRGANASDKKLSPRTSQERRAVASVSHAAKYMPRR